MSDVQTAPKGRAYQPRQSNAERAESRREAVVASVQRPPEELRIRAQRQAKAQELERLEKLLAAMDEQTPEAQRRGLIRQIAQVRAGDQIENPDLVWVTVRPRGEGKISMGEHVPQVGDAHFERGERVQLPLATAKKYEDLAWVDIDGGD